MRADRSWVIVTGISGSGRTTALRALEDLGFFCVDNLPSRMLPDLHDAMSGRDEPQPVAVGIDARAGALLDDIEGALAGLESCGVKAQLVFLDCADDVLVRRFSETRRRHPLPTPGGSVLDSIRQERALMLAFRERTSLVVDTSELNIHQLKARIQRIFEAISPERSAMLVAVNSFGFKHGLPRDADYVFDVRFLGNPHFVPELRPLTGRDPAVSAHVLGSEAGAACLGAIRSILELALPLHDQEGRALVNIAIGCTGGQHRSVAMAEALAAHLRGQPRARVSVRHRDLARMSSS